MEGANFENKLKDKLADYPSPLDLELEWADLESRRNKKRRKRPFFWIWFGAGILFISGSFLFFGLKKNKERSSITYSSSVIEQKQAEDLSSNHKTILSDKVQKEVHTPSTITPTFNNQKRKTNNLVLNEKILSTQKNKVFTKSPQTEISNNIYNVETSIQQVVPHLISGSSKSNQKTIPTPLLVNKIKFLKVLKVYPKLEIDYTNSSITKTPKKKRNWSIGASIAYGTSIRDLTTKEDELVSLIDRRNQAEEALDIWQTSLMFRKSVNDKWFIDIGFGYAQSTDRFKDIKTEYSNPTVQDQIIRITHLIEGGTRSDRGDVIGEAVTISDNTFYQYQGNGFIQLSAGRNFMLNDKHGFSFSSGFKVNAYTFKQGKAFIDDSNSYADLKDSNLRKTGIINSSSNLEYYWVNKNETRISIGLQGEFQLNNTFLKNTGLNEKRNNLGLYASIMKPLY